MLKNLPSEQVLNIKKGCYLNKDQYLLGLMAMIQIKITDLYDKNVSENILVA